MKNDRPKVGNSKKFRRQRQAVAKNKLLGMTDTEAVLKAGYAPITADKSAWKIVRHPEVQSILTASCARVLAKYNKTFDDILEPFVRGLDAKIVVKMPQFGDAVVTDHADIPTQMAAAEHLVDLHRVKQAEGDGESGQDRPPVNLTINFVKTGNKVSPMVVNRPTEQAATTIPGVSFVKR